METAKTTIQREPVAIAAVVRVVTYLAALAVSYGYMTQEQEQLAIGLLAAIVPLVETVLLPMVRNKVTPIANPYDDDGVPLVPVTYVAGELDIATDQSQ